MRRVRNLVQLDDLQGRTAAFQTSPFTAGKSGRVRAQAATFRGRRAAITDCLKEPALA